MKFSTSFTAGVLGLAGLASFSTAEAAPRPGTWTIECMNGSFVGTMVLGAGGTGTIVWSHGARSNITVTASGATVRIDRIDTEPAGFRTRFDGTATETSMVGTFVNDPTAPSGNDMRGPWSARWGVAVAATSPTPTPRPTPLPTCVATGANKSPVCAEQCTSKYWRWNFWVTNFNVNHTLGNGEHQGIALIGHEYTFDPRYPPTASTEARSWTATGDENQFVAKTSDPENTSVTNAALCSDERTIFRLIYNHGRTVATQEPGDIEYSDPPIKQLSAITVGPLTNAAWRNAKHLDTVRAANTTTCVRQIEDGFCDSVCGNCSYVIPLGFGIGAVDTKLALTGQTAQFVVPEMRGSATSPTRYYQGGIGTMGTNTYEDTFTHCFSPTSTVPQQALVARIADGPQTITGLFGHNSNTDAEAELRHFESCQADPARALLRQQPSACTACGTPAMANGKPIQYPCIDNTNTAREDWSRTDGLHNIDDDDAGSGGHPPACLTNGQPVKGM